MPTKEEKIAFLKQAIAGKVDLTKTNVVFQNPYYDWSLVTNEELEQIIAIGNKLQGGDPLAATEIFMVDEIMKKVPGWNEKLEKMDLRNRGSNPPVPKKSYRKGIRIN